MEIIWPVVPDRFHHMFGVYLLALALFGTALHVWLFNKLRKSTKNGPVNPSNILFFNFILANIGLTALQCPFSGYSSLMTKWVFGDMGCQAYAIIGFIIGIGCVLSCFLIVIDQYLLIIDTDMQDKTVPERQRVYIRWIFWMWLLCIVVTLPPTTGKLGRFSMEPCGTACTLDFWHTDLANYRLYAFILVVFIFSLPALYTAYCLWTIVLCYVPSGATEKKNALQKFCVQIYVSQMVLWSPYAILGVWVAFYDLPASAIYLTFVPAAASKLSSIINGYALMVNSPMDKPASKPDSTQD